MPTQLHNWEFMELASKFRLDLTPKRSSWNWAFLYLQVFFPGGFYSYDSTSICLYNFILQEILDTASADTNHFRFPVLKISANSFALFWNIADCSK